MVGHPFDTLKTKMQAQKGFETGGMIQTFSKTIKTQGVIGLYRQAIFVIFRSETRLLFVVSIFRGCLPPLMGSGVYRSLQFAVFEAAYVEYYDYYDCNIFYLCIYLKF